MNSPPLPHCKGEVAGARWVHSRVVHSLPVMFRPQQPVDKRDSSVHLTIVEHVLYDEGQLCLVQVNPIISRLRTHCIQGIIKESRLRGNEQQFKKGGTRMRLQLHRR